jgi:hypothetical protein
MSTMQNPGPTALLPIDPAVSPQQALRIPPIRARLLPEEITAGRNVRRTRTSLIVAVVLVIGVLAGWYLYAVSERNAVDDELIAITDQVDSTRRQTRDEKYLKVTKAIEQKETIEAQLKTAMKDDVPWETVLSALRNSGVKDITINNIVGTVETTVAGAAPATTSGTRTVASLTIMGEGRDKKTIAAYLDKIAGVKGVTNVYLSNATSGGESGDWTFAVNADLTSDRLCGRFTDPCKSGGK